MHLIPEDFPPNFNDAINTLPFWLRDYIHDLATRTDPAGDIKTIHELRENVRCLEAKILEMREVGGQKNWAPPVE